jgi:formate dehydrogenase subunit gamma
MRKSTELTAGLVLVLGLAALAFSGGAAAQAAQQGQSAGSQAAPTRSLDDPVPAAPGGIQGQNIFDVKPEVKPDASSDPKYMQQGNGERNKVQPGNNAPMWRGVASGMEGFSSLPKSEAPEAGVLIQAPVQYPGSRMTTAGEAWRQVRNNWIIPYGAALFLISLGALAIYYFAKGPMGHADVEAGGAPIERFTPFERSAHWANAIAFSTLAISGLVMAFGKFFLLPVIGGTLFGWLTYTLKTLHNFAGPLFAVSPVIVFFTFVRDQQVGPRAAVVPLQRRREGGVLAGRAVARRHRRRFRPGARQADPRHRLRPRQHAGGAHGPRGGHGADDVHVRAAHLPGHHRHARRLQGHAPRPRQRGMGPRAPRILV